MGMETEERMTIETVDICPCGVVMHQANPDDYDTLGATGPVCCPDCGNEVFQTIKQLRTENEALVKRVRILENSLPKFSDITGLYADDKEPTDEGRN